MTAVVAAVAGCGGGATSTPRYLSIATGGTGGVYYPYGGAVARVLSAGLPGIEVTAEVTGASVDNLKLLQQGQVDLAFTLADALAEAHAGTGPFRDSGAVTGARALAVLYTNYTHVVARAGSGIARLSDLAGRVVSVGSPGSGTELLADRLLAAAGVDPHTGIVRHPLGVAESAGAMKDGKIDAFFWSGGVPTPAVQDLAATPGMTLAFVPQDDVMPALQGSALGGLYSAEVIPSSAYRGLDRDVAVIGAANIFVASDSMDEALAYDIVRLIFEEKAALVAAHPEAAHLAVPAGPEASPVPFHPGAVRYYREHGWR